MPSQVDASIVLECDALGTQAFFHHERALKRMPPAERTHPIHDAVTG